MGMNRKLFTMFAYLTDLHGNLGAVSELLERSKQRYPKLRFLLVGGDITRKPDWNENWVKAKNESISEACRLFSELDLETYFILGNDDIESPLAVSMNGPNFHGMTIDVVSMADGIGLLGFSYVPPTSFFTRYERCEKELEQMLEPLFKRLSKFKFKIAMCHAPYGTNLDITKEWYPGGEEFQVHAGSKTIRKLVEKYHPDVGLFGHVHESAGYCRLGRTLCVNPGASNKKLRGCVFGFDSVEGIGEFELGRSR